MARDPATKLELRFAGTQVEFVVDDENRVGRDAEKACERRDRTARHVHERHRLANAHVGSLRDIGRETALVRERHAEPSGERVGEPESGVVARIGIAAARIAEARDEPDRSGHRRDFRKRGRPIRRRDAVNSGPRRVVRRGEPGATALFLLLVVRSRFLLAALVVGLGLGGLRRFGGRRSRRGSSGLAFDGGFLGFDDGLRHDGGRDDRITRAARHDLHARRQLDARHVQRMRGVEIRQVDLDELRQILRQARDVELRHHVADDRALRRHRGRQCLVHEVQRHFHVNLARRIDPLKIDVQHLVAERVHLHVAEQYLRARAIDFHRQDRRVERFGAQRVDQRVVVELDHGGLPGAVDDAGHLVGFAQAAARSGPLQRALESDEFHGWLQYWRSARDQAASLRKGPCSPRECGRTEARLLRLRSCCSAPQKGK